ncbi:MAG: TlyA family rRNA (cytidine-2'-O)-methyltransferase [Candidatus Muiribacterium halophilum]|uniref:TlyA family rRNA (Cytidine-2'-O)-methyltransferase n=1 Tax=Muiribacterium halophilum TaxID=2053465 RepID=A0A2N5ZI41_MUIH1|nr:MAG: TlyA family rRNA (cytidine-2'-O)-methyltransferase [Candidatus Muirbacterium halophilum]
MKKRLDLLLVEKGFFNTRTRAQADIMAGRVYVNGQRKSKSGEKISEDVEIKVVEPFPYVSRGALKLKKAKESFGLDFSDKKIIDIGASTGGFTQYSLEEKAEIVYAIDVGYGQLDMSLRDHEKVVNLEKVNFRYFDDDSLLGFFDMAVCDVSFISIKKIIPNALRYVKEDGELIFLIKPQFEAQRKDIGKKGIIKDSKVHEKILKEMVDFLDQLHVEILAIDNSGIKGTKGNREFLVYFRNIKKENDVLKLDDMIQKALLEEV